jgi:3-phosphoshikimate 1-carboxyvinyltransferase
MSIIRRVRTLRGRLRPPGDKSLSHRYAIVAALARKGEVSRLDGFNGGGDCRATLDCLAGLGIRLARDGERLQVVGTGLRGLSAPSATLFAAGSGTTARLLAGVIAGAGLEAVIDGDDLLRRRPMERIAAPLRLMGAEGETTGGSLPMRIRGAALSGIDFEPEIPSAQVRSCIMFAALYASSATRISVVPPSRDHTERLLAARGASIRPIPGGRLEIEPLASELAPLDLAIPGDISAAAYPLCAAATLPGSELTVEDVLLNSTRTAFLDVLQRAGADLEILHGEKAGGIEEAGTVTVRGGALADMEITPMEVPFLIDELPALAAAWATQPGIGFSFSGAAELRRKESDRIALLARNLRAMGAKVSERADGLVITGARLRGIRAETGGDHRIAMAVAVAGLSADGETTFDDPTCVEVSYPRFFEQLAEAVS